MKNEYNPPIPPILPPHSPTADLIEMIYKAAREKGYRLDRWKTGKHGHDLQITYAIYDLSAKPFDVKTIPMNALKALVTLTQEEGKSKNSYSYQKLQTLLVDVLSLPPGNAIKAQG